MPQAVFELRGVFKTRPGTTQYRLEIPQFHVYQGEAIALIGPSGCGKSTALDLFACALRPDGGGSFFFSPQNNIRHDILKCWKKGGINGLAPLRMRYLGYVLQTGGLLPFLTARDNILFISKALGIASSRTKIIEDLTSILGISSLLDKYPAQLSMGERQRVAIAKALAHGPSVVLADEPTAALDPENAKTVMKLFLSLARTQGATVIIASHDRELIQNLGFQTVSIYVYPSKGQEIRSVLLYSDGGDR